MDFINSALNLMNKY